MKIESITINHPISFCSLYSAPAHFAYSMKSNWNEIAPVYVCVCVWMLRSSTQSLTFIHYEIQSKHCNVWKKNRTIRVWCYCRKGWKRVRGGCERITKWIWFVLLLLLLLPFVNVYLLLSAEQISISQTNGIDWKLWLLPILYQFFRSLVMRRSKTEIPGGKRKCGNPILWFFFIVINFCEWNSEKYDYKANSIAQMYVWSMCVCWHRRRAY